MSTRTKKTKPRAIPIIGVNADLEKDRLGHGGEKTMSKGIDVFIVTGEASGDLHAGNLVRALRAARPDVRTRGFGGTRLAEAGGEVAFDLTAFSIIGLDGIVQNLGQIIDVVRLFKRELLTYRPKAVVLIDYPGLNFVLARVARSLNIPVVYYVCPQLWAWAPWRVKKIRRLAELLLVIFPFEERFFSGGAAKPIYVGHPLCDELGRLDREELRRSVREQCGVKPDETLVGLFPGSRRQEVAGLGAMMKRAALRLRAWRPGLRFAVSCLKEEHAPLFPSLPWSVVKGPGEPLMAAVDLALVASGTASLELAFFGKPMVVVYRLARWKQRVFSVLRTTPFISTVNLLARRELIAEIFVDGKRDMDRAVNRLKRYLAEPAHRRECERALDSMRERWMKPGASAKAAALILELCDRNR